MTEQIGCHNLACDRVRCKRSASGQIGCFLILSGLCGRVGCRRETACFFKNKKKFDGRIMLIRKYRPSDCPVMAQLFTILFMRSMQGIIRKNSSMHGQRERLIWKHRIVLFWNMIGRGHKALDGTREKYQIN